MLSSCSGDSCVLTPAPRHHRGPCKSAGAVQHELDTLHLHGMQQAPWSTIHCCTHKSSHHRHNLSWPPCIPPLTLPRPPAALMKPNAARLWLHSTLLGSRAVLLYLCCQTTCWLTGGRSCWKRREDLLLILCWLRPKVGMTHQTFKGCSASTS